MSNSTHLLKGLLIPLFTAALLYLLTTHLLLPFIRRHRTRSSYLPLPTSLSTSLTTTTTSWRTTLSDALYTLFMPSTWRRQRVTIHNSRQSEEFGDEEFDDEEGEGMVGFAPLDQRGREEVERDRGRRIERERLGRELEEGFRDDSEEEDEDERQGDERRRVHG